MINTRFQKQAEISGDSQEDTALLRGMARDARKYLLSFDWCPPISEIYLAFGIGGVVIAFLIQFSEKLDGSDEFLWVINGDVPDAYFVTDDVPDPESALRTYCDLMEEWANAVICGNDLADVFPVSAKPTRENAEQLQKRLRYFRESIIPNIRGDTHGSGSAQARIEET